MKALMGSWEPRPSRLLAEVASLRTRVAELHGRVERLEEENEALRRALAADLRRDIDLEMELVEAKPEVALST